MYYLKIKIDQVINLTSQNIDKKLRKCFQIFIIVL